MYDDKFDGIKDELKESILEDKIKEYKGKDGNSNKINTPKFKLPEFRFEQRMSSIKDFVEKNKRYILGFCVLCLVVGGISYYFYIPKLSDVVNYSEEHNVIKLEKLYDKTLENKNAYADVRKATVDALVKEYIGSKNIINLCALYNTIPKDEVDSHRVVVAALVDLQDKRGNEFLEQKVVENSNRALIIELYTKRDSQFLDWKIQKFKGQAISAPVGTDFKVYESIFNRLMAYSDTSNEERFVKELYVCAIKPLLNNYTFEDTCSYISRYSSRAPHNKLKDYFDRFISLKKDLIHLEKERNSISTKVSDKNASLRKLYSKDLSHVQNKHWRVMREITDHEYLCEASDGYVVLKTKTFEFTTTGWMNMDVKYVGRRNGTFNVFEECNDRIENNKKIYSLEYQLEDLRREENRMNNRLYDVRYNLNSVESNLRYYLKL